MRIRGLGPDRLGSLTADRYRTVPEACILDILLHAGWVFELQAGGRADAIAHTAAAIEDWIALGLGYRRGPDGARCFDPVEVVNFLIWAGRLGLDRFWEERYVRTGRAHVMHAAPMTARPRRLHLGLRRRFGLHGFAPGKPVRLRLPLPLDCDYLGDVAIRPIVPAALAASVTVAEGRMEVRLPVPPERTIEIGADIACTPRGTRAGVDRLTPAERALYRRPVEGLIRVSPRVQALADELAGPSHDPWRTLSAFWAYLLDELFCGVVHYDQVDVAAPCDWVLDRRWYDCQLGSALLVSLCRARGIPARMIGGHLLYPLAPMIHFWAEAWIDGSGWMPFDLSDWWLSLTRGW
jgi:hypothetical protein